MSLCGHLGMPEQVVNPALKVNKVSGFFIAKEHLTEIISDP
jgi:hypothetical protein